MRTPTFLPALCLALALVLLLASGIGTATALAAETFDPNTLTCSEIMRGDDSLKDLVTLFTYSFLSGIDYREGLPVSALDRQTYESTEAAVNNLCKAYPEKTLLEMIAIGLSGKKN